MSRLTYDELKLLQALPLEDKIKKSQLRIREWYNHYTGQVYISFSGGKDSTVLLHLIREQTEGLIDWKPFPNIPAVYCDTGLEYPEIREFVNSVNNLEVIRPTMSFRDVIKRYGYPIVSKEQAQYIYEARNTNSKYLKDYRLNGKIMPDGTRGTMGRISERWKFLLDAPFKISAKCCDIMKKRPFRRYEKVSGRVMITGEMASESLRRRSVYLMRGCNAFDTARPKSTPLGFWTEQDILQYLKRYGVPYCPVYGSIEDVGGGVLLTTGIKRTGCMYCMFGAHLDPHPNRFVQMKETHPKLYSYCINQLGIGKVLDYIHVPY